MRSWVTAVGICCGVWRMVTCALAQDWTLASAPTNAWSSVACSADGTKIYTCAGGGAVFGRGPNSIYASIDGGLSWAKTDAPSNAWGSIACSADATKVVAAVGTTAGGLYTSKDGGLNWRLNDIPSRSWRSVASSADGSKLFAVTIYGEYYATTNGGTSWVSNAAPSGAWTIACSADGKKLVAAAGNRAGYICTSTNSGATWTTNTSLFFSIWWSVASSADGSVLAAVDGSGGPNGHIMISTNSGASWFSNAVPLLSWQNVAVSADGTKVIAAAWNSSGVPYGPIYTSTNTGATWVSNNIPNLIWNGVGTSGDGGKLIAVTTGTNPPSIGKGTVWIAQAAASPALKITAKSAVQLSWIVPSTIFHLEQSPDLMSWVNITSVPTLNLTNLEDEVSLPIPAGPAFYRLESP